jgi:hypothetical protein
VHLSLYKFPPSPWSEHSHATCRSGETIIFLNLPFLLLQTSHASSLVPEVIELVLADVQEDLVLDESFHKLDRRMSEAAVEGLDLVDRRGGMGGLD